MLSFLLQSCYIQGQAKDVTRYCAELNGMILGLSVKVDEADEVVVGHVVTYSHTNTCR